MYRSLMGFFLTLVILLSQPITETDMLHRHRYADFFTVPPQESNFGRKKTTTVNPRFKTNMDKSHISKYDRWYIKQVYSPFSLKMPNFLVFWAEIKSSLQKNWSTGDVFKLATESSVLAVRLRAACNGTRTSFFRPKLLSVGGTVKSA